MRQSQAQLIPTLTLTLPLILVLTLTVSITPPQLHQSRAQRDKAEQRAQSAESRVAQGLTAQTGHQSEIQSRHSLVHGVAVQLSDALRRSGCVATDAPFLIETSAASWGWERMGPALSSVSSHVAYYWGVQQADIGRLKTQLQVSRPAWECKGRARGASG